MRVQLRGREVKKLAQSFPFIGNKRRIEIEENDERLYYSGSRLVLVEREGRLFPILREDSGLKQAVVDMGAVPFVCKGADVMRPGVKEMPEFEKGELLIIIDERNRKPLAVAETLYSSEETRAMSKGVVFKNLHHVGDKYWGMSE